MEKCWAHAVGGCSSKISGEHLISNSLLEDTVTVRGFSWCIDEPKTIGASRLTANFLCTNHNAFLSKCDSEILKFKTQFCIFNNKIDAFNRYGFSKKKCPLLYNLNGPLIEKWFCKTIINISLTDKDISAENIDLLVPFIFGNEKFNKPYGLNYVFQLEKLIFHPKNTAIECAPLYCKNEQGKIELAGGLFVFQGLQFIVIFPNSKEPFKNNKFNLTLSESNHIKEWNNLTFSWHHIELDQKMKIGRKNYKLQSFVYNWES